MDDNIFESVYYEALVDEFYDERLAERTFDLRKVPSSPPVQTLLRRGIDDVVLGDKQVPDVHGVAAAQRAGFRGYGRGGFSNSNDAVWVDSGESAGHPAGIHDNFYWGATVDPRTRRGELRVKGARAGADETITKKAGAVIQSLTPRVPKVK